jgi:hypothetical protein
MMATPTFREVVHEMAHVALRRLASPMTVTSDSKSRDRDMRGVESTGPRQDLGPSH